MAHPVPNDVELGTIVYPPYLPSKLGVVVERFARQDDRRTYPLIYLRVQFMDGTEDMAIHSQFNDYKKLVEETERKAIKHREAYNKAYIWASGREG